jgi:hypothetical protein
MALNPKFRGQILAAGENPFSYSQNPIHTLELYMDYGRLIQQSRVEIQ